MSLEWEYKKLGKLCSFEKEIISPIDNIEYIHYSFPAFDNNKEPEIEMGKDIKSSKFIFKKGDILYNKLNVKFKRVWNIDFDITNNSICSTEFIPIQSKDIDRDFLYYSLISPNLTNEMKYLSTGTSNSHQRINPKDLKDYDLFLPKSKDIQHKIGYILKLLDKRIAISMKINHNLEKISSRLYSNLIYDKKDLEFIELKEICKFIKGRKPTEISEQYKSDFEDYLTIEVLSNQNQTYAFDEKGIKAEEMDILMVMDGASSGKLFYGKKGLVGSTLAKIDVKENYIELVYQFLKINEKYITENTTGSAIPHTDKGLVLSLRLPISEKLTEYSDKFKNIRLAIISNNNEIMKLQHLRDILLPKLMSGEIDVSEVNCDLD